MKNNHKAVSYNKWGYIFLIPFVTVYIVFQLVPLFTTIYNSFFENYMSGLKQIGPNFVGLENYKALFASGDIWKYLHGFRPADLFLPASWRLVLRPYAPSERAAFF